MRATASYEPGAFGVLLRRHRLAAGLTQEALAEKSGLSARGIADLERGTRRFPYAHTLQRLVESLELAPPEREALLAAGRRPRSASETTRVWVSNNLPLELTSFIGREHERAELQRLLRTTTRLLTLTGTGGVGKTRLALQIAAAEPANYPDGVWLLELEALADRGLVAPAVAAIVGVREQPGRSLLATLAAALQTKRLLLVLDNCEHLVAACAELANGLLRACPHLQFLATSREPLGVIGEIVRQVPPLAWPDQLERSTLEQLREVPAVRLFVERARATQADFELTEATAPVVAEICRRLDGIPLALELAAARVRVLGVQELSNRLDDSFTLLVGGSSVAPRRQQTLRATLDWSYALLSEPEGALFARLAVFAGGWTLEAAEAVCVGSVIEPGGVLGHLARLADRSLLVVVPRDDGTVRYRLLETVRQYAQERLSDRGDAVAIRQQHADFFLALAESAATQLRGPAQVVWLSRLENEHDNLRGALRWCLNNGHIDLALRLSGALWWFWWLRGYWHEGRDLLRETLLASTGSSAATRVEALNGAGNLAMASGDYALASEWLTESLALRADLGDRLGTAGALHNLAHLAREQGNYERAAALYEQSHSLFRAMENKRGIAQTLGALGDMAMIRSDFEVAEACYSESLDIWKSVGSRADVAVPLCDLGLVALQRGDHARAAELLAQSLTLFREADDRRGTALALRSLGAVASADGDYERALTFIYEGLARFKEVGDMRGIADSLEELAYAAALGGRAYRAARLYGAVDGLRDALRAPSLSTRRAVHERGAAVARSALKGDVFDAARAAGRALSAEQIVAEVLVDAQPLPASPAPTAELPADPLTPREREVVVLVAQGLTNRQIASALVITERTAENHLGHIFDKLAVASRTQVATWALNRGLIPVAIPPIRR